MTVPKHILGFDSNFLYADKVIKIFVMMSDQQRRAEWGDRKSTRLNSSHLA